MYGVGGSGEGVSYFRRESLNHEFTRIYTNGTRTTGMSRVIPSVHANREHLGIPGLVALMGEGPQAYSTTADKNASCTEREAVKKGQIHNEFDAESGDFVEGRWMLRVGARLQQASFVQNSP